MAYSSDLPSTEVTNNSSIIKTNLDVHTRHTTEFTDTPGFK